MDSTPPVKLDKKTLRQLQLKQLDMLRYFKSFCDEHGLLFYFCGGCCIGERWMEVPSAPQGLRQ